MHYPSLTALLEACGFGYTHETGGGAARMIRRMEGPLADSFWRTLAAIPGLDRFFDEIEVEGARYAAIDLLSPRRAPGFVTNEEHTAQAHWEHTLAHVPTMERKTEMLIESTRAMHCAHLMQAFFGALGLGEVAFHTHGAPLNFPGRSGIEHDFLFSVDKERAWELLRAVNALGSEKNYFSLKEDGTLLARIGDMAGLLETLEPRLVQRTQAEQATRHGLVFPLLPAPHKTGGRAA